MTAFLIHYDIVSMRGEDGQQAPAKKIVGITGALDYTGVMDERDFYTEKPEAKQITYTCPKCRQAAEFQVRWLRRTKKKSIPPGAGDFDRAKFAKARDYLVRVDDRLICPNPRCRNRFEIPNDQTVVFI